MSSPAAPPAASLPVDAESQEYLRFHQRRYDFLLATVRRVLGAQVQPHPPRILDIGMSFETVLLRQAYPDATVDTLGYFDHRFTRLAPGLHTNFDLNHAVSRAAWPVLAPYDLIVMAEVIEHLHVSPVHVLRCAASWLRPGGTLLLQTPNPVSLGKRWRMLLGGSPFEIIREDPTNPGHFCEYTAADLRHVGSLAGLVITGTWLRNYFGPRGLANRCYSVLCALLPGSLADGITVTLRKPHL